jgi:hypothetical protein
MPGAWFGRAAKGGYLGRGMGRLRVGIALVFALAAASPASAQTPVVPWDGTNPFRCQNQNVGMGVDFPDPGADPFCVEFDKT